MCSKPYENYYRTYDIEHIFGSTQVSILVVVYYYSYGSEAILLDSSSRVSGVRQHVVDGIFGTAELICTPKNVRSAAPVQVARRVIMIIHQTILLSK
jgi:hypothetical protein